METKITQSNPLRCDTITSRKAGMLMAVALAMPVATQVVQAQGYGSSIAQTEIARRAALVEEADKALLAGRTAFAESDFEEAVKQYQIALNLLPPGPALSDRRNSYTGHLGDASLGLSQQYSRVGKYAEARELLESVKAKDPGNFAAIKRLEYLDDPIRTNPALTYEHTQDVDKVRKSLYTAEGYYNLGKYDAALAEYQKVLQVDKTNTAARRGMERVNAAQSSYQRAAYDQTRSQMLMEVDRAWELAVPAELPVLATSTGGSTTSSSGVQYIQRKLNNIIIPSVSFEGVPLEEVIDELRIRARELDSEPDDLRKGINFVLSNPAATADSSSAGTSSLEAIAPVTSSIATRKISGLSLTNIPLGTLLDYIKEQANLQIKIDDFSVTLSDKSENSTELYSRQFIVPPDFISKLSTDSGGDDGAGDDPFGDSSSGSDLGGSLGVRANAQELLQNSGITFSDKASASYIASTNTLIVRNTLSNLDAVERLVEAVRGRGDKQVKVSVKFIEIAQENTDELGFDWAITSGIDLGGSSVLGGGTLGSGSALSNTDFSNGFDPTNGGTVTAGNRSGSFAISSNSIDSIINNPNRNAITGTAAPGILSLTGVFNEDAVTTILRGLNQKKGTDVLNAPSIVARSGETASINVIREFIYPTEYEPPELPTNVGSSTVAGGVLGGASASTFPVTPATPTAFETRNTGVSLTVTPIIGPNNYTIDLNFLPEIVEFEGFINYGSPIQSAGANGVPNVITENRIEMPVFATRKVETQMTIYDGYTVAVGGLMREDVQNVEDKVPILGDLPIIGRLFQSKAENRIKSNLIIFVTAEIVDPAGLRVNQPTGGSVVSGAVGGLLPPLPGQ